MVVINGTSGNDQLLGTNGDDTIYGHDGDDYLSGGGNQHDLLYGGRGNDTLRIYASSGTLANPWSLADGGEGFDTAIISMSNFGSELTYVHNGTHAEITCGRLGGVLDGIESIIFDAGFASDQITAGAYADTVHGNGGNDIIKGLGGNDVLSGGTGNDDVDGGAGDDFFYLYAGGSDIYKGGSGTDTLSLASWSGGGVTIDLGVTAVQALSTGSIQLSDFEHLTGSQSADTLTGTSAANIITGGAGADRMTGKAGDDIYYVDDAGDVVVELAGQGIDRVASTISYSLVGQEVENLTIAGASGGLVATGNDYANTITDNSGGNRLEGLGGADTLIGGNGWDTLLGGSGADTLTGDGGSDTLDGGSGADMMFGGIDGDTYIVDDAGDVVVELANEGTDSVQSLVSHILSANVEFLKLMGSGAIDGTGNASDNSIQGNDGANRLDGGAGADQMYGGLGNDTYVIDNVGDTVSEVSGGGTDHLMTSVTFNAYHDFEIITLTGSSSIDIIANQLANTITGNDGANRIDGGWGLDIMIGGLGNDVYLVSQAGDQVQELANQGTDTVESQAHFSLVGLHVENLILSNAVAQDGYNLNGTGNDFANSITGNHYANRLTGGAGADTLTGGAGADTFVYTAAADSTASVRDQIVDFQSGTDKIDLFALSVTASQVSLIAGSGHTVVNASGLSIYVSGNVTHADLILDPNARDPIVGTAGDDALNGTSGNDTIDGLAGADMMTGGAGHDRYVVDNVKDKVIEGADGGSDTVEASVSFSIAGQYIETLNLTGSGIINGSGNNLANTLIGNDAANVLNGAGGADAMSGGLGNDRYIVDNAGDTVTESGASGGTDRVDSAVTFTLGADIENLILTGSATIHGTGNALANTIVGNATGNILDGGAGADTLEGRLGNDRYIIDNVGDKILELANEGTDIAEASISFSLAGQYVETLRLVGTDAINGTGNGQANSIYGNAAANTLSAGAGDDKLYGGAGNDRLTGGAGLDRFIFDSALNAATNVDKILDFSVADDGIYLDRSVFSGLASGSVAAGAFVNGTAALDAGDRIVYDKASGNIFYDADGSGAGAAILFANVAAGTVLANTDFIGF